MAKRNREGDLSSQISSLINTAPDFGEEEDDFTKVGQLAQDEAHSDSGDELNLAQFRKINIELLDAEDKKYAGVRTTRKAVDSDKAFGSDSSGESDNEIDTGSVKSNEDEDEGSAAGTYGEEELEEQGLLSDSSSNDEESEDENNDEDDSSMASDGEECIGTSENASGPDDDDHISPISAKVATDIEKGHAIRNQFNVWDSLLECRIKFQKCLTMANKLPKSSKINYFKVAGGEEFSNAQKLCQKSMKRVLNVFLELQNVCLNVNTKHYQGSSAKRSVDEDEITSDSDKSEDDDADDGYHKEKKRRRIDDFSGEIGERHEAFIPFRNDTIQKWNDKTRVTQMGSKDFTAFEQSTLKQIETVLSDRQRLLKRTRTKRSNYHVLGENDDDPPAKVMKIEECPEIFDDDDFYHQLLRELLERKTTDVTDPVQLSRQWIQLQKERNKMKKTVDTKASKGRKIRYDVHQKLVNFMMPIDNTTWTDEARSELLASLFGKKAV